ncbi:STE/STE7/MEK1 protein kinase [Allomyces macrogynus ATCC 38327]|uniref:STE/STE7/MEK1 protein kinase n=1 Tax=Allomyces macrogynus (strain ATCC 38327) TaxID=578462 RepID=A0A0L0SNF7_ALLM3|nr:STE/STE7/MEK1 protein kinase [Allomyces macrogynus ATCC 38327]|eukprot:KNE64051.1 STE/STE7/MEK1 protein kinase [Allomyces macrogynus ATCC 38327]
MIGKKGDRPALRLVMPAPAGPGSGGSNGGTGTAHWLQWHAAHASTTGAAAPSASETAALLEAARTGSLGELRKEDLVEQEALGEGASGAVVKCVHVPTGTVVARKTVAMDPATLPAVVRELTLLHSFASPYIVQYYGCYTDEASLCMCMEYCELGSLDQIASRVYAAGGFFTEDLLGKICVAVVHSLRYLHRQHRVIHRDVKPSNIVVTRRGEIKLCDFGVSGLLVNSMANTFVGTSFYMSPERIQGQEYTVRSDVWSLGISLLELAIGRFPYPFDVPAKGAMMTALAADGETPARRHQHVPIFEVLDYITKEPAPTVPPELIYSPTNPTGRLSTGFRDFIDRCLVKDPAMRPPPEVIMKHGFFRHWDATFVDTEAWANMLERWQ